MATVSFVLNAAPDQLIGMAVQDRVRRAAQLLNYHPNASAVNLARHRTRHVAIALYEEETLLSSSFYFRAVEGALKQALERKYHLLLSYLKVDDRGRNDLPTVITQRNTEGVLFIKRLVPAMVAAISAIDMPIVAIDPYPPSPLVGSVSIANRQGGELAAEYLGQLGHKRLAVVTGGLEGTSIADRAKGYFEALRRLGLFQGRRQPLWKSDSLSFEGGFAAAIEGMRKDPHVTGVFCVNDELAAGVIRAAHQLGYRVPDQLSVIGFGDIDMARHMNPPLTTIGVDELELGRKAMSQLIDLIEGRAQAVIEETVDVKLVVRGSTGNRPVRKSKAA